MQNIVSQDIENIMGTNILWEKWKDKKILVTGATGYLMTYFVKLLIQLNKEMQMNISVYCLCRSKEKVLQKFGDIYEEPDLNFIYSDICEPFECSKMDIIVHAASPANPALWNKYPVETMKANILGTSLLLEKAVKWETTEFVYISSSSVYGSAEQEVKLDENYRGKADFCDYRYAYNLGKQTGELLCKSYEEQFGLKVKIVRPFIVYGPGMEINQKKAFTDFLFNVLEEKDIVLKSDGHVMRSYCYIADAISGIATVMLNGEYGRAYNIANAKESISILDLAKTFSYISEKENKRKSQIVFDIPKENQNSYLNSMSDSLLADTTELERLGWNAAYSLNDGIVRTVKYYKEEKY